MSFREKINLNPEISQGVLAIFLIIVSGLSLLSFFSLAGVVGQFLDALLAVSFGQVRYVFPLVLLVVVVLVIQNLNYEYRPTHLLGSLLFFFSFNGLVHLQFPVETMIDKAMQGGGGGLMGAALAYPLLKYANFWGALIVLVGLLLVSIIFLFNTSLAKIVSLHKQFFLLFGWFGRGVVGFFDRFRHARPESMRIVGAYSARAEEEEEEILKKMYQDEEDVQRTFTRKSILQHEGEEKEGHCEDKEPEENETTEEIGVVEQEQADFVVEKPKVTFKPLPPLDLLVSAKGKPLSGDVKANAHIIKETLSNFGIDVEMDEIQVGPTVTQYSLKPAKGVKLNRLTALSNDLALALSAHPIRIEAPIPGKPLVGIEVPNQKVAMVTLRELLEDPVIKTVEHKLMIGLGKDVAGKVWFGDLPKMPHLLIAGTTGSGKTVCINTVILSLLYQNTPETLRFIMVDPKRVELTMYNGIPHLLTPVITDSGKTVNALRWAISEMERRFDVLAAAGKRDIGSFNKITADRLPYIVFVIDELADLMATAAPEVEGGIIRLAQMARAVGIHLIVATQRPSVEVITGLMKANIPARIAFSVASVIDSRTILDTPGAEKLLGRGDMLYLTADLSKPKRLQGAYVSEEEMKRVIDYWKGDEPPMYDESIVNKNSGSAQSGTMNMFGGPSDDQDSLFADAKAIVLESGKASASLLQRRLKVGYARAARLLDELEEAGIVGPGDGAKPREVFTEHMSAEEPSMTEEETTMDSGGAIFNPPKDEDSQL